MKKPYTKPEAKRSEVDSDIIRMLSAEGFVDLFWNTVRDARKSEPNISQEKVFDRLNEKYYNAIGCTRYSSYNSFRQILNKK